MKTLSLALISTIFFAACSTKRPKEMQPEQSQQPELEVLEEPMNEEKAIESRRLDNGLEVFAIHKGSVPMVTVLIAVKNGAYVETPDIDGLAHLYEHMFFKANEKIPSQREFLNKLDEMGIELGPNMNAYTSTESVRYFFTIQNKYLEEGLDFMADAVIGPKFLQEELEKERKVVKGEFDIFEATPMQVFFQFDLMKLLFPENFTRKNTIGNREVIMNASQEQMKQIQKRFYIPNNSALFIVGDFNDTELWGWVDKTFSRWKPGNDPFEENPIPAIPPLDETKTFSKKDPKVQTVNLVQAYHGPSLVEDDPGNVAFDLASIMLSLETSPFQKELVHSGLASSASFWTWSQRHTGPAIFSVEASPEKSQEAYDKLQNLIQRIASGNFFTENDLNVAKTSIEVKSAYDREIGQRYALGLASIWTSTGDLDFYTNYVSMAKAASLEQINQSFVRYIKDKNYVAGALLPETAEEIEFKK